MRNEQVWAHFPLLLPGEKVADPLADPSHIVWILPLSSLQRVDRAT